MTVTSLTRRCVVLLTVGALMVALVPGSVAAQGGGELPSAPSAAGGKVGSPGMSGGAAFSVPDVPQPTIPQPSPPSFTPPDVQPPTFNPSTSNFAANLGSMSVPKPGTQRPGLGTGQRPNAGGGNGVAANQGGAQSWGSGFAPFSSDSTGQVSRFGPRGSGNIPLDALIVEGAFGWLDAGGFGAPAELPDDFDPSNVQDMAPTWRPEDAPPAVPPAPGAYDDLSGITGAAQNAQEALAAAGENRDATSAEVQANIQNAAGQAQQAYDQFWQDYYNAVDATAQAYYDAMTATADILLQTYMQAVDYAVMAVDYYVAYYDQYATYCYYYPWDCAMYAYDVATGLYYYTGDVSDVPVGSVALGDVPVEGTYPVVDATPAPSAEAYQAVTVFASDQLGAVVEPLYAGDATDSVQAAVLLLPPEIQSFALRALLASCGDYWALLNGGAAGIMTATCASADDLDAALSSEAVGVYALYADAAVPTDSAAALALITHVYPALTGLAFAEITDIDAGMAFTATAAGLGFDPATGATLSVPKVVYAGVVNVAGVPFVYALVGVGESYANLIAAGG